MENTKEQVEHIQPKKSGPARDIDNLKKGTTATVEELREFVAGLKGRSPQEVLGIVASNGLTKGIIHATFGWALLLVSLTLLDYSLASDEDPQTDKQANAQKQEADDAKAADNADSTKTAKVDDTQNSVEQNQAKAANAMGIDKVKDPDANPLDNQLNNLLDIE